MGVGNVFVQRLLSSLQQLKATNSVIHIKLSTFIDI